ncbi:hypothetical protein HHI36_014499 [Cryptolaemus montrouzieri]|uniref:Uncharacterized protein n=1 Tax=Cryptolaemus montrouzieri TaxID=559131 RepID=A0ABD2N2W8_9CUCU
MRIAIQRGDRAYRRFKITRSPEDLVVLKIQKNYACAAVRFEQRKFYEAKIDSSKDYSRTMWRTLKELIGSGRQNPSKLNEVTFETDVGCIEEKFNDHFMKSIESIANEIKTVQMHDVNVDEVNIKLLSFEANAMNKLEKIIRSLKNKATEDDDLIPLDILSST